MVRLLTFLILQLYSAEGFFPQAPKMQSMPFDGGDPLEPLFLTPYVEAGKFEEGRRLARVTLPDVPDIESYSGFITVNKMYNSNLFFWYFPPINSSATTEVIVYLQGFPGVSSMYGQFEENGPIEILNVENGTKLNQRSFKNFNQMKHLIYIDHSVGAGFSFTNDSRGYCTDQVQVGEQLYAAVVQIFQLFPVLQKPLFHITGELYAGKFATALARTIHQKNPTALININLESLILGSCWCDPINQMQYHRYTYQMGIHDWRLVDKVKIFEDKTIDLIKQEKWLEAANYFSTTFKIIYNWTHPVSYYNIAKKTINEVPKFVALVQTSEIRKALHVGDLVFQDGENVREALREDYMKSVAPWIAELEQNYSVKFYNGPLGAMVTYRGMINFIEIMDPFYKSADNISLLFYAPDDIFYTFGIYTVATNSNTTVLLLLTVGNLAAHDNAEWSNAMLQILINPMIINKKGDFQVNQPYITIEKVEDISSLATVWSNDRDISTN